MTDTARPRSFLWTALIVVAALAAVAFVSQRNESSAAPPIVPVMGQPFTVDGYTVTLTSLRRISDVDPSLRPLPGQETWVLGIELTNDTGSEQDIGTGFRLQDDQGRIESANPITIIDPVFRGDLAAGGRLSGYLTFSIDAASRPVAVLVKPGGLEVAVRLEYAPWPSR